MLTRRTLIITIAAFGAVTAFLITLGRSIGPLSRGIVRAMSILFANDAARLAQEQAQ